MGLKTVCIDAGHGGHDAGCISRDKIKTQEKDLALSIALSLQKKIKAAYAEHFGKTCSKSLSCMDVCPMKISTLASMAKMNR